MSLRTLQNLAEWQEGTRRSTSGSVRTQGNYMLVEKLTDEVKLGDNGVFDVERWKHKPIVVNGQTTLYTYTNYVVNGGSPVYHKPQNLPPVPDNGYYAAKLLAMTNPSRADVDLPVFIAELREVPELFKIFGETAFKTVAKANLAYWFGWKPLADDLMKMCNFSDIVNKRADELRVLFDRGLARTRDLDSFSSQSPEVARVLDSSVPAEVWHTQTCQTRIWGHCKWKPLTSGPRTNQQIINLARRAAFGLTIDPVTAWELIPFSWMVDWFSSVGSFLEAHRNTVPSAPYDVSIMRHDEVSNKYRRKNLHASLKESGMESEHLYETKSRRPAVASIEAYLPYLTGRQLSILGSLYVLKNKSSIRLRRGGA